MSILSKLSVILSLDSAKFKEGLDDATKNLKQFEANNRKAAANAKKANAEMMSTLGAVAAGAAVAGAALYKMFEKADGIADMASAFDASIGSIVGMGKALEQSGGKAENLGTMLSKLTVSAQNAKDGSDSLRDSFKQVGITAGEVEHLNPDELLERVAQQLAKIPDATERNAKAVELLGKAAKGIDWAKYVEEYKKMADPDLAAAIKESADAFDNIAAGVSHAYYFMIKLIQPFAAIVNMFAKLKSDYDDMRQNGGDINFDPDNPMAASQSFKGSGKDKVVEKEKSDKAKKADVQGDAWKKASEKEKAAAEKQKEMLWAAQQISIEYERQQKFAIQQLETRIKMADMTHDERRVQEVINQVLDSTSHKIDEITKKREDAIGRGANQKVIDEYNLQINKVQELSDKYVEMAKIREEAAIAEQRTFSYGWDKAYKQYAEDAYNYGKIGEQSFAALTNNMSTAIDNFVETGKLAFGDFAKSVIKDMIRIQLQASASRLLSQGIGLAMAAFSGGSSAGAAGGGMDSLTSSYGEAHAFADGGTPPLNQPSIVGERGPELFVPQSAGKIVPNHQLGMGQTIINDNTTAVTYSIQAVDASSFRSMLARDPEFIHNVAEQGRRSLPIRSRR